MLGLAADEFALLGQESLADIGWQAIAFLICILLGYGAQLFGRKTLASVAGSRPHVGWSAALVVMAVSLWVASSLFESIDVGHEALRLAALAVSGMAGAQIAVGMIGSTALGWLIAALVICAATLEAFRSSAPVIAALDAPHIQFGSVRISPWFGLKALSVVVGLFWIAQRLGAFLELGLSNEQILSRSGQALFSKLARAALYLIAVLLSLSFLGVDVTTLAVLSGAIGLGLGFGLQKVISNYVAGLILLLDRSIKPGDVIEVDFGDGRIRGEVTELAGRYTAITLRTGTETLIPNEVLISSPVTNWSHTSRDVQVRIPVGVSYSTNVERAIEVCAEAAQAAPRVLAFPKPVCLLVGFGDSSVDLDVRFWINDSEKGVRNVSSGVYLEVWRRFRAEGIEIPFPQRDLHIRSVTPFTPPPADQ